jgi:heterotetrameric sarcosine oxidase gamma subunit
MRTTITALDPAPLHAVEIWSNPQAVAARVEAALGMALPPMGQTTESHALTLMRFEPTVWLAEGDVSSLVTLPGEDGAITAIGGSVVRVRIAGPGWREVLMEGGVFDAENAAFAPGCCAATIIDHVNVRLFVESADAVRIYVPSSYAAGLIHFWEDALSLIEA